MICKVFNAFISLTNMPFGVVDKVHEDTTRTWRGADNWRFLIQYVPPYILIRVNVLTLEQSNKKQVCDPYPNTLLFLPSCVGRASSDWNSRSIKVPSIPSISSSRPTWVANNSRPGSSLLSCVGSMRRKRPLRLKGLRPLYLPLPSSLLIFERTQDKDRPI